ncbi:GNAT family N-acetyltransferase [Palleronia sp.]|uniref:GNAT family N-acetyltransferase n=1 Tax=Palleronia sp. TaxID=1940284 RepID=UPI0035C797A4
MSTPRPFPRIGRPGAAPTVSTERLTLRPMTLDDWPAYRDTMGSDRSVHMGGPFALNAAWAMFTSDIAGWHLTGAGALAIDAGRTTVGQAVLNDIPAFPDLELGWMLYDGHEGQGYATEAAAALLDWARVELTPPSLVSYVAPGNQRSAEVARRIGGIEDAAAPRPEPETLVFRHLGEAA